MASIDVQIADLRTLNEIAATLNESADTRSVLDQVLAKLVNLMGLETGWIFMVDEGEADKWWGKGFVLAAHHNLPPALALDEREAWLGGCDCQGLCTKGKLEEAFNEVHCSRLGSMAGDKHGLVVHASAPIRAAGRTLGILNVAAPSWDSFSPRALALLSTVGIQIGTAVDRARVYDLLRDRRHEEQAAMLAFSNQLLSRPDLDDLMDFLVREVRRLLQVDACAVLMPADDPAYLVFQAAAGWREDPVVAGRRLPASGSGSGQALRTQEVVVIPDTASAEAYPALSRGWLAAEGFRSAAVVPLIAASHTIGTLVVDTRTPRDYGEEEIRFLQLMANQAALAIEQARLRDEEIARQRLEDELAVGRQIQLSLLPTSSPSYPGWEFGDIYQAAHTVGGDLYDFFELPEPGRRLGVVIGDVSDKGVPAALFMGVSRTVIRTAALGNRPPAAALEWSNEIILNESYSSFFLSAFYAILDLDTGRLAYSNAGHNPPLLYRAATAEFEELTAAGIVLGVLPAIALEEKDVDIAHGDVLVFYTDGVTEAMNHAYEEFGAVRLRAVVRAHASDSASDLLCAVIEDVNAFTAQMEQSDDFTLFVIKRR